MADWTMTATTMYCDAVDEEVTFIVAKDSTVRCTGYTKYFEPDKETAKSLKARGKRSGRQLTCEGLKCHRVTKYTDKLFAGETGPGRSANHE